MNKKITIDIINKRLEKAHLIFIGNYIHPRLKCKVKCLKCEQIIEYLNSSSFEKMKCNCDKTKNKIQKRITIDIINKKLQQNHLIFIGEYSDAKLPCKVKCLKCEKIIPYSKSFNFLEA